RRADEGRARPRGARGGRSARPGPEAVRGGRSRGEAGGRARARAAVEQARGLAAGARGTGAADPPPLLEMADGLLRRAEPATAGLWPRVSALLALQALEAGGGRVWQRHAAHFHGC